MWMGGLSAIFSVAGRAKHMLVSRVCACHSKNLERSRPAKRRKRLTSECMLIRDSGRSCHVKKAPRKARVACLWI